MTNKAKIYAVIAIVAVFVAGYGVHHLFGKKPQNKGNIDVASITTFEQCSKAGFPIIKHYPDQCQTPDGRIFANENPPSEDELAKAEQVIRTFMGDWDHPQFQGSENNHINLVYVTQKRHPSNFAIYKPASQPPADYDFAEEYDRPVYIFQQKEFANDRCQVYEYQVAIKTKQVVEVGLVFPEGLEAGAAISGKCSKYGSMDTPSKNKDEIEQIAFTYMSRDPEHTKFLIRSDIQPEYFSSKSPTQHGWQWEDKSYKLPEGLVSDPFPYPMLKIIMSGNGKLVYYLNTTDLFPN
ncbi:MAG: hypothetical protein GX428_09455 [Candidatus Atribacteria bacterium]|nr:hypothetical protein [Candidatus Atribacteria bacterium]